MNILIYTARQTSSPEGKPLVFAEQSKYFRGQIPLL